MFTLIAKILIATVIIFNINTRASIADDEPVVEYKDMKVTVDGEEYSTIDEPVISGGTTYLPVRAASSVFGEEIQWNE